MFAPSREEARRFFCDAWRKYRDGHPLSGLEATALQVISRHPEYHALIEEGERAIEREWSPEQGEMDLFCTCRCTSP
jgi:RecB family endonuclease NucS